MWTRHGHVIANAVVEDNGRRPMVARCGGIGVCPECTLDAWPYVVASEAAETKKENPEKDRTPILRYFDYLHLPPHLQKTSRVFHDVATWLDDTLPNGPEKSTALRKLLESKDAAVRAALDL